MWEGDGGEKGRDGERKGERKGEMREREGEIGKERWREVEGGREKKWVIVRILIGSKVKKLPGCSLSYQKLEWAIIIANLWVGFWLKKQTYFLHDLSNNQMLLHFRCVKRDLILSLYLNYE